MCCCGTMRDHQDMTSWWLNQPTWKILVKMDHFPQIGVKIRNIWNHQPDENFFLHAGGVVIIGVAATASIVKKKSSIDVSSLKNSAVIRHFKKFHGDPQSGQINTNVQRDFEWNKMSNPNWETSKGTIQGGPIWCTKRCTQRLKFDQNLSGFVPSKHPKACPKWHVPWRHGSHTFSRSVMTWPRGGVCQIKFGFEASFVFVERKSCYVWHEWTKTPYELVEWKYIKLVLLIWPCVTVSPTIMVQWKLMKNGYMMRKVLRW